MRDLICNRSYKLTVHKTPQFESKKKSIYSHTSFGHVKHQMDGSRCWYLKKKIEPQPAQYRILKNHIALQLRLSKKTNIK